MPFEAISSARLPKEALQRSLFGICPGGVEGAFADRKTGRRTDTTVAGRSESVLVLAIEAGTSRVHGTWAVALVRWQIAKTALSPLANPRQGQPVKARVIVVTANSTPFVSRIR